MPRGDRTGPGGMGSRTGRGLGYCSGANAPGFANPAPGFGMGRGGGAGRGMGRGGGFGRGGGRGRGFWGAAPAYQPAPVPAAPYQGGEQEQAYLQRQADALQTELDAIKKRLAEME